MPVLLHAITLPCGADVFWQIVGNEFQSDDWKVRFTAGQQTVRTGWKRHDTVNSYTYCIDISVFEHLFGEVRARSNVTSSFCKDRYDACIA